MDDGKGSVNREDVFGGSSSEPSSKTEDGSGQDHVEKHGHVGQDHVQEHDPKGHGYVQDDGKPDGQGNGSEKHLEKSNSRIGDIDTTAPFESVKEAVSMFSGIVDWKAHKIQIAERRKRVAQELRKAQEEIPLLKKKSEVAEESKQQVLKELDSAKRRIEELKLELESAQTEESQAKQDAELLKLRAEEMEQGITVESSVAAKAQLEVVQARHQTAVSELKTLKIELENLQKSYTSLVFERDLAIQKAEEAVTCSTETEKNVEDLTIKLITVKEALESAHGAYLEAEEQRTEAFTAQEQDGLNGEHELKQSEEEWERISEQIAETEDLESKLEDALVLLHNLKAELASYMRESHVDILSVVDLAKTELEEVKKKIENVTSEVNGMKVYANSLNSELEQGTEAVVMVAVEAELTRTVSEATVTEMKENALEKATEEAEEAKARAKSMRKELQKAKAAVKQAKKREKTMISKLNAAVREVEAARASERFAVGAISAVEENESGFSSESSETTLSVEKYRELSRRAKEAEDEANDRVSEAISQIDLAKESEVKSAKQLEQVKADLVNKKEQLSTAIQKADKAKEGKLVVERELKIWRSENEQRRNAESARKKKKRWLIPRICLFLCRKKGRHSNKNNA